MRFFISMLFIMLSMHVGNAAISSWEKHYIRMHQRWGRLPSPSYVCRFEYGWRSIFGYYSTLRCSSIFHYSPIQTDGNFMWCAEKHGKPIEYTLDTVWNFPYDCSKTRQCSRGTVHERTSRCETKCEETMADDNKVTFGCDSKCICSRGMYRNLKDECVWKKDCPKLEPCKAPMYYSRCASKCPLICATQEPNCDSKCAKGIHCVCPKGTILLTKYSKTCVKPEKCPKCDHGSLAIDAAPACPTTCPGNGECNAEGNEEGAYCVCGPGKIRLDRTLPVKCVTPEECPPICKAPRVLKGCGTACPPTCDDPNPGCIEKCVPENICSCPDGYVQRSKTDKTCVKRSECITCNWPAIAMKCNRACPSSCAETPPQCSRECKAEYVCGCPHWYIQQTAGADNVQCVKPEDCPTRCPSPKVYKPCASVCQPTCQDRNPGWCKIICNSGVCVCPQDMVQPDKDTLECIKPEDCPTICESPKIAKGCGTACPATCDDPEPICTLQCTPENICTCPDGFVQRSSTDKTCVKLADCFDCPAPGIPVKCSETCPESCEGKPIFCRRECPSKYVCGCPAGYVLLTQNGKECVKKVECPPKCPPPQRYVTCGSLCQPTCQNLKPASCKRGCSSRTCICPRNMVQPDEDTFTCIFPSKCPQECTPPKILKDCPSKCQPTCQDPTPDQDNCAFGCRDDKCICPSGFILLSTKDKTCVKISRCPKQCTFPKVRANCRSSCVASCDNLNTFDGLDCPVQCGEEVCVCADGYVQRSDSDTTCVEFSACPPVPTRPPVQCEEPKFYAECASKCPPTCLVPNPLACTRGCDPTVECVCPSGYVQPDKKNTTCIKLDDCPVCEAPKVFAECASKCRPTCRTPNPRFCDEECDPGVKCVCPPGMVHPRNGDDSCILLNDCPESCRFPEVGTGCASNCPATCNDPVPKCEDGCKVDVSCVCPTGLLQRSNTNTTCLLPTQCPGLPEDCGLRKIPTRCASGCPATCANRNPRFCTKPCRPNVNCECPRGMVQKSLEDNTCVWPYQCDE